MDEVTITLHHDVADSVYRIVREYRMKKRTGLLSYERNLLKALEDGIQMALEDRRRGILPVDVLSLIGGKDRT